jgi:hypothetical protein
MFGSVRKRKRKWRRSAKEHRAFKLHYRMNAKIKDGQFWLLSSESVPGHGIQGRRERTPLVEEVRLSPLQERLLSEFMLPNSAHAVARSARWAKVVGEPVTRVVRALQDHGLLVEPNDARARMCHGRNQRDLQKLCLDSGLEPVGSVGELVDRLLVIDPTGWLLGYAGELLQCSEPAARAIALAKNREQCEIE